MAKKLRVVVVVTWLFCCSIHALWAQSEKSQLPESPLILAHYMPWYVAKPINPVWGWHWTMNAFDPEKIVAGNRQIASHYYPAIGPYDSSDPFVLEYHLLLMKLSGIDGVIVDWYGMEDFRDYAILHRNTERLVEQLNKFGMKFAICYEDQTIPALVEAGRITTGQRIEHAKQDIAWLANNWASMNSYVRIDGKPILLSFGNAGLSEKEWEATLAGSSTSVAYFSEHNRRSSAVGAFDWPIPKEGLAAVARFESKSRQWPHRIPVAFSRFKDIYAEAKVHESWGSIPDENGATFRKTLQQALKSGSRVVQIATWNDWGEGTGIEPSREFGLRDLTTVQQLRREHMDPKFAYTIKDLRLPSLILQARRSDNTVDRSRQLDEIAELVLSGKTDKATAALQAMSKK